MVPRSAAYKAGLKFVIEQGGTCSLAQLFLAIQAAISPPDAFDAGLAHRKRLAKRFGKEDVKDAYDHRLLAMGERRIAWNTIEAMKRNGRITIDDPVNHVRLVRLATPPLTGGRVKRQMTWDEVLRDINATDQEPAQNRNPRA